jgi:hypothetical protein
MIEVMANTSDCVSVAQVNFYCANCETLKVECFMLPVLYLHFSSDILKMKTGSSLNNLAHSLKQRFRHKESDQWSKTFIVLSFLMEAFVCMSLKLPNAFA